MRSARSSATRRPSSSPGRSRSSPIPTISPPISSSLRQTLAGERRSYQLEKRYFHKLGRVVWVLLGVSLVRTAEGEPSYFISQIQDIGERRNAQEAVARSEARLAEAQHIARVGSWEAEFATGTIAISQELCRLFELDPAIVEVKLDQLLERIHPDDRGLIVEANVRAGETNEVSNLEYRIVLADGSRALDPRSWRAALGRRRHRRQARHLPGHHGAQGGGAAAGRGGAPLPDAGRTAPARDLRSPARHVAPEHLREPAGGVDARLSRAGVADRPGPAREDRASGRP